MKVALSIASLVVGLGSGMATAATYTLEILTKANGGAPNTFEWSIAEDGSASRRGFDPNTGEVIPPVYFVETFDISGEVTRRFSRPTERGLTYQGPIRNEAGQVAFVRNNDTGNNIIYQELVRIEPDGSLTILAERPIGIAPDRPGIPTYSNIDSSRFAMNGQGDVAAILQPVGGPVQVVRFLTSDNIPTVLADDTGITRVIEGLDINNNGQVAFTATEILSPGSGSSSSQNVYIADGTSVTKVISGVGFSVGGRPALNDNGDVVARAASPFGGETGYILQKAGAPPAIPTYVEELTGGGAVASLNLNNFGQIAYVFDGDLYIDDEKIIGYGDRIPGVNGSLVDGPSAGATLRPNFGLNDLGQVISGVRFIPDLVDGDSQAAIRINPLGATPGNPILPFSSTADGQNLLNININNGLGVTGFLYIDPIVAEGFIYTQETGLPGFAQLLIPEALPLGDRDFVLEFDYTGGRYSGAISVGDIFDFLAFEAAGVSSFSILGIDIAEAVDPTDPFLVGVKFVEGGFQSTLAIDAITIDTDPPVVGVIPLPPGMLLLASGIFVLGLRRKKVAK